MADQTGKWLWPLFQHLLPHSILSRIAACMGPASNGIADMVGWRSEYGSTFRVSKAYELRADINFRERNAVIFENPLPDSQPLLVRCMHLKDATVHALALDRVAAQRSPFPRHLKVWVPPL
ncbi:hypothetical protein V6N13_122704 [Hibiscus sabdariffa]|uniref:Uncharacterized protein n=1 Tax=Hibiscus sabdariffa TaxID=183260 RepID=A0ABR2P3Y9_9ROSI